MVKFFGYRWTKMANGQVSRILNPPPLLLMGGDIVAECPCGKTKNLFFRDNRWWCPSCVWAEILRLRAIVNGGIAKNIITSNAGDHPNPSPYQPGPRRPLLHRLSRKGTRYPSRRSSSGDTIN